MTGLVKATPLQPIKLKDFTLTERGVTVTGSPTRESFLGTFDFVVKTHKASGWWLVDLIAYADSHPELAGELENELDSEVFPEGTLKRYRLLAREFPPEARLLSVPMSHHLEVLPLPEEERVGLLEDAAQEGWTVRDLRQQVRALRPLPVVTGQAALGKYRVILADVPWPGTEGGSFAPLSYEHLSGLPVAQLALPSAVLFLWVPDRLLLATPGPVDVLVNWGFVYRTSLVWDKVFGQPGDYGSSVRHEHLIIATRGQALPDSPEATLDSIVVERKKAQSDPALKPSLVRRWIEQRWTVGPYLDLFSRIQHEGWDVYSGAIDATPPKKPKALPVVDVVPA